MKPVLAAWATGMDALQKQIDELERKPGAPPIDGNFVAKKTVVRLQTKLDACGHKGGPEMGFAPLFGHMCYVSHRFWRLTCRVGIAKLLKAWRKVQLPEGHQRPGPDEGSAMPVADLIYYKKEADKLGAGWVVHKMNRKGSHRKYVSPDHKVFGILKHAELHAKELQRAERLSDPKALAGLQGLAEAAETEDTAVQASRTEDHKEKPNEDPEEPEPSRGGLVGVAQEEMYHFRGHHLRHLTIYMCRAGGSRAEGQLLLSSATIAQGGRRSLPGRTKGPLLVTFAKGGARGREGVGG